LVEQELKMTP